MSPRPTSTGDPDLLTVHDFANKYRVDDAVVRSWVKHGLIDYVLVGPRHMRCVRPSAIVKPIIPSTEEGVERLRQRDARDRLERILVLTDGMDRDTARLVLGSMSVEDIDATITEREGNGGTNGQG